MTASDHQVRRATVEDLPQLRELWRGASLPWQELEKAFKDFQVVQTASGRLVAALGLQISGSEGRLFAEAFLHPENAESYRRQLWERALVVAQNHGLVRVWVQSSEPFWQINGFCAASAEQLGKLPPGAALGGGHPWLVLQLRDEASPALNLEREFALFQEAQRAERAQLYRQARVAKAIALIAGLAVFGLTVAMLLSWRLAATRSRSAPPPAQTR